MMNILPTLVLGVFVVLVLVREGSKRADPVDDALDDYYRRVERGES